MAKVAARRRGPQLGGWRVAGWSLAATLLLAPLIAMHFTRGVNWTASDFVVFAAMLGSAGFAFEFLARRAGGVYRLATAVGLLAAFLLVWVNLAVGIIGSERNPANGMYVGVLALAIGGAAVARFRPAGMAHAALAAAVGQVLVAAVALAFRLGADGPVWPRDVIGATVILSSLWLISAMLFARAARRGGEVS